MARPKKKPEYDSDQMAQQLMEAVTDAYLNPSQGTEDSIIARMEAATLGRAKLSGPLFFPVQICDFLYAAQSTSRFFGCRDPPDSLLISGK